MIFDGDVVINIVSRKLNGNIVEKEFHMRYKRQTKTGNPNLLITS